MHSRTVIPTCQGRHWMQGLRRPGKEAHVQQHQAATESLRSVAYEQVSNCRCSEACQAHEGRLNSHKGCARVIGSETNDPTSNCIENRIDGTGGSVKCIDGRRYVALERQNCGIYGLRAAGPAASLVGPGSSSRLTPGTANAGHNVHQEDTLNVMHSVPQEARRACPASAGIASRRLHKGCWSRSGAVAVPTPDSGSSQQMIIRSSLCSTMVGRGGPVYPAPSAHHHCCWRRYWRRRAFKVWVRVISARGAHVHVDFVVVRAAHLQPSQEARAHCISAGRSYYLGSA